MNDAVSVIIYLWLNRKCLFIILFQKVKPPKSQLSDIQFSKILLHWYTHHKRDLPWRRTRDPYRIWVSEIMLQQTQVRRVEEFYGRFLERFPDAKALAKASWKEVLKYWQGLGYYRRARNLHVAAKILAKKYGGIFPSHFEEILDLPGIGRYTAAAIVSFAFDQQVAALDTNAEAVLKHVFGHDFWDTLKPAEKFSFARSLILKNKSAVFNHAMMDVGSFLKSLKDHTECPFNGYCQGPILPKKRRVVRVTQKYVKVAAGVLIYKGKVLIAERKKQGPLGGFWEFPGGKVEPGEDQRSCLKREMKEELGIEVSVRPAFYSMITEHGGNIFQVSFHRCSLLYGHPKALHVERFVWITPQQFQDYKFLPANKEVLSLLQKKKAMFRV